MVLSPLAILAGSMFAVALVFSMLGQGGGILKVPLMVLLLGVPMDIAVGSSAFMVGMTASGGFAGHLMVLLSQLKTLGSEVSVVAFPDYAVS